jgi:general stress protein 26
MESRNLDHTIDRTSWRGKRMHTRLPGIALFVFCVSSCGLLAQGSQEPTAAQIRAAAFDVMKAARYCTLVTIAEDGQPQARIVDPLIADREGSIWIATNPLTRKVKQIERDPRVTLMFFNPAAGEYVTVLARAAVVTDAARKAAHWKPEWKPFYSNESRGPDFMVFEIRPFQLEVSSPRHKMANDPKTWRPVILKLPATTQD